MKVDMHKQRGAVLIVSLILLLLISAIAISTISSSTFQTSMAANAQQRESVLRAAESAAEQPLTDDNLSKAYNAFLKWNGTKAEADRVYDATSKLKGGNMSAKVLHLGTSNAEYFDPKQYKYYVYESRGFAHSADDDQDKAKVATEVVQGVAKLSPSGQAATYDPY